MRLVLCLVSYCPVTGDFPGKGEDIWRVPRMVVHSQGDVLATCAYFARRYWLTRSYAHSPPDLLNAHATLGTTPFPDPLQPNAGHLFPLPPR